MSLFQSIKMKKLPHESKAGADNLVWNMPLWIWTVNGVVALLSWIAFLGLRSVITNTWATQPLSISALDQQQIAEILDFAWVSLEMGRNLRIMLLLTLVGFTITYWCNYVSLRKIWNKQTQDILPKKMVVESEIFLVLQTWGAMLFGGFLALFAIGLLFFSLLLMLLLIAILFASALLLCFLYVVFANTIWFTQIGTTYFFYSRAPYLFSFRFWSEPRDWLTIYFTPPLFARRQIGTYLLSLASLMLTLEICSYFAICPRGFLFVGPSLFLMLMSNSYFAHLSLKYYITDYRSYRARIIDQKEQARLEDQQHASENRNIEDETTQSLREDSEFEFEDEEW